MPLISEFWITDAEAARVAAVCPDLPLPDAVQKAFEAGLDALEAPAAPPAEPATPPATDKDKEGGA